MTLRKGCKSVGMVGGLELAVETTSVLHSVFGHAGTANTGGMFTDSASADIWQQNCASIATADDDHVDDVRVNDDDGVSVCNVLHQLFATCFLGLQIDFSAVEAAFTCRMNMHGLSMLQQTQQQSQQHMQTHDGDVRSDGDTMVIDPTVTTDPAYKTFILSKQKTILAGLMDFTARTIGVMTRLYKGLIRLVKYYCSMKLNVLPSPLVALLRYVCTQVNPQVHAFLLTNVYNVSSSADNKPNSRSAAAATTNASSNNKRKTSSSHSLTAKCERRIPECIYQMEQLDVMLIKLTGMPSMSAMDKRALHGLITRTTVRDFRIMMPGGGGAATGPRSGSNS